MTLTAQEHADPPIAVAHARNGDRLDPLEQYGVLGLEFCSGSKCVARLTSQAPRVGTR